MKQKITKLIQALEKIKSLQGRQRSRHGVTQTASYIIACEALEDYKISK